MPSGRLGAADLAVNTDTSLYTVPTAKTATVTVSLCNRGTAAAKVRIALAATAAPGNAEFLHYDYSLAPNATLERTGIVADAGKIIVVRSDLGAVSAVAYGFEE